MSCRTTGNESAVSPVIGVMLMIVVTIIIAAVVSAFAGDFSGADRKAPTAVFSVKVLPWVEVPAGNSTGILFTHEGGDFVDLHNVQIVLACGDESIRFQGNAGGGDSTPYGYPHLFKVNPRISGQDSAGSASVWAADYQLNTGNQFMLYADNNGNGVGELGWASPSVFYLKNTTICTYSVIDSKSRQAISGGKIDL